MKELNKIYLKIIENEKKSYKGFIKEIK